MELNRAPAEVPARDLDQHLDHVRSSPRDAAPLELIVGRPGSGERETLEVAVLDAADGLVGDTWFTRGSRSMPDKSADPSAQLTLMNTRVLLAIEPDRTRWPLAGDQLYLDLDLSEQNLPAGTRLTVGSVVLEVSELPHTGCVQFSARFGADALRWISTPAGRAMRMRGMYVRVVTGGTVRVGDVIRKA
ncbi:MAG: MOSC domain-containing protein [Chloroflexi bacterium]|nr:MOSC domain-containing protein [Chloroflexota bacterium]